MICENGHSYDETKGGGCPVCRLRAQVAVLMRKGWYGSAKNLAEWMTATDRALYGEDLWLQTAIARSAWEIGDLAFAAGRFENLLDRVGPEERRRMEGDLAVFARAREQKEAYAASHPTPWTACNDPRLGRIIDRLSFLFLGIGRPVDVFVADSEADYRAYILGRFPGCTTRFGDFQACGFHGEGADSCIVFRRDVIDGDPAAGRPRMDDEALLGLAAHEMAHLELSGMQVDVALGQLAGRKAGQSLDMYVNERLTDLCVIARGLALALFFARAGIPGKSSDFGMSQAEITQYMGRLLRVRDGSAW